MAAANAERGELSLVVDGMRYVLSITLTAMMELEDISGGRTFIQAWRGIQENQSIRDVMLLMWAALREHHPEIAGDGPDALKTVSRFVERAGGLEAINAQLSRLMELHAQPSELRTGDDSRPPAADAASATGSPGADSASKGSAAA
jgi:hypothetical protein